jgi:hypothetical protein
MIAMGGAASSALCCTHSGLTILLRQDGEASVKFYRDVCYMTLVDKVCVCSRD